MTCHHRNRVCRVLLFISALATACGRSADEEVSHVAVGTVVAFAGERVPPGWLLCDGRALDREAWPELFSVLGTTHGTGVSLVGEEVGDFNLPDYRGRFLRGVDMSAAGQISGADVEASRRFPARAGTGNRGNRVGSYQPDATAFPRDPANAFRAAPSDIASVEWADPQRTGRERHFTLTAAAVARLDAATHNHRIIGGDIETRPKNVAVQWIIRARP
jgi:hypothetical protein